MTATDFSRAAAAPNPQFRRDNEIDLCGDWDFAHDDADLGVDEGWWRGTTEFAQTIRVPYPPESELSGLRATGFHPVLWYRRSFTAPSLQPGERLQLHFGAVDYRASVWVNGQCVATHEGGHVPFSADITSVLQPGEQVVVVRAEDPPEDVRLPRGKQDWLEAPHAIWYHRTSGIWQPVWLSVVPALHLTDIAFTPDLPQARVHCAIRLSHKPHKPVQLSIRLVLRGEELAAQTITLADSEIELAIAVPQLAHGTFRDHLLWSPERPNLVDAEIMLEGAGTDRVLSYLGLRSVGAGAQRFLLNGLPYFLRLVLGQNYWPQHETEKIGQAGAQRFLLNGLPYFLRLVLGQNYWPQSHLAAPEPEALRHEAELIKALGFNGVRIHQKIEDPRFLYWCDVLGLIVWEEMPSAYAFSASAVERLTREWLAAIRRDRSHPSIVAWVPFNESWGVHHVAERPDQAHYASALYHLTKALDPSRLAISNDGWELVASDIWSVHDYAPDGASLAPRLADSASITAMLTGMGPARRRIVLGERPLGEAPVMLTEFGGLSYTPREGEKWHGYATVEDEGEFADRLEGLFAAIAQSPHIAGYCYTQLTDTEQEVNGLLTAARTPKLPFDTVARITTMASAAMPNEKVDQARRIARKAAGDSTLDD